MNTLSDLECYLILAHVARSQMKVILERCDSPQQALSQVPGWEKGNWQTDLHLVLEKQVRLLPFTDPLFPQGVEAPLLYIWGNYQKEDQNGLAIVGTRQGSLYGKEMARKLARDCAASGKTIISGLARGVDTAAHCGALEAGRTVAVLGSGLAAIYPPENLGLAEQISKRGAVISEYPMETSPQKHHFPKRNRLIAALSRGVLLAEAPLKSGAILTMAEAKARGKKLFALPGRVDMDTFQGNHMLIKTGQAALVETAEDILGFGLSVKAEQPSLFDLDPEEKKFYHSLPSHEISLEELLQHSQYSLSKLSALLMGLVLKQKVREFPGKRYQRKN